MPFVRIEMLAGKPEEYRQAVLDEVHAALVEAFRIPDHDRTQRLVELRSNAFEFPAARRPDPVLIEIACFAGRSTEAKRQLFRRMTERLERRPGIEPRNVCIVLNEIPRGNWAFGGLAADQMDLGFKVDV